MKKIFCALLSCVCCLSALAQNSHDAILKERLESPRCIRVVFDGKYNGFHIEAVYHPDDEDADVGMASYTFSKKEISFSVDTPYYWRDGFVLRDKPQKGIIEYKGETYHSPKNPKYVQGKANKINIVYPFCFKDVDFDGEKEICFSTIGYNRTYYSVYKLTESEGAVYLSAPPYNNIIYGAYDGTTTFDYKAKTIKVFEQFGPRESVNDIYVRREPVDDIKDPMVLMEHSEWSYVPEE